MIQKQLDHHIQNMLDTKNDHSAPYNETCLQTVKIRYQGGAESSDKGGCCETKGGCSEIFPSLLPAHHPRSQSSQNNNTTEPKATKQQEENMPSDRATAIPEVQADILSTLKKASYKYHYRLFADYLEILQIELDRIIEIQEYMDDQEEEDMIKFKTEHYQEYRFHSIHDRQPTLFVQNVVTTNIRRESPSPECGSPVRESFAQIIRNFSPHKESSDDSESDSESDTTKKQAWSTDDSSDSSSDEDE